MTPTWGDCRRAFVAKTLSADDKAYCDKVHRSAPKERTFGIRWVFLGKTDDAAAWIKPRLTVINKVYAPVKFSFITSSTQIIDDSVMDVAHSATPTSDITRMARNT